MRWQIRTLPFDACRGRKYGYAAIPELFMPLVEELRQERETWLTNWRAQSASDSGMERAMTMLAADMFDNRRRLDSVEPGVPYIAERRW